MGLYESECYKAFAPHFNRFLTEISLTEEQIRGIRLDYRDFRSRIEKDSHLSKLVASAFMQGSYRCGTAIRPINSHRPSVDVVVVTNLDRNDISPSEAQAALVSFLELQYKEQHRVQGACTRVSLSNADLDVISASASDDRDRTRLTWPCVTTEETVEEAPDWRVDNSWLPTLVRGVHDARSFPEPAIKTDWPLSPLYVPDTCGTAWEPTHPLEQIRWTTAKNKACNGFFVSVMKALKYWRRLHPFPLSVCGYSCERLLGHCCPDGIASVAQGVLGTFETFAATYRDTVVCGEKPSLPDHGVPENDVLRNISAADFKAFYEQVSSAGNIARAAIDARSLQSSEFNWCHLFGPRFPTVAGANGEQDSRI